MIDFCLYQFKFYSYHILTLAHFNRAPKSYQKRNRLIPVKKVYSSASISSQYILDFVLSCLQYFLGLKRTCLALESLHRCHFQRVGFDSRIIDFLSLHSE